MFRKIKGQNRAITILQHAIMQKKVAQSYLFYGPEGVGKHLTAIYFAMALNCYVTGEKRPCGVCNSCKKFLNYEHPDFIYLFPAPKSDISTEGEIKDKKILDEYKSYIVNKREAPYREFTFSSTTSIRIDQIRYLQHRISVSPNEAKYKIYLIDHAEQMTTEAANAFLKTLEEPPSNSIIILTTTKVNSLLPTILSRCQKIPFYPVATSLIEEELRLRFGGLSETAYRLYARHANGNLERAFCLAEEGKIDSLDKVVAFLEVVLAQDDLKMIQLLTKIKTIKNPAILIDLLSYLTIWLYDLSMFIYDKEEIINLEQTALFALFYQQNPQIGEKIPGLISYIENLKLKLEGHVNSQLILTDLYRELSEAFYNL